MIKNANILKKLEYEQIRKERLSYSEALKIFEAMWGEAVAFKVLPSKQPLEGIEVDIRIAGILNSCLKNS